jgi:DNA-binding transcriptional LysR family regulator
MPPPRISLDQWRALTAVVESGGYAQAAEALHKSQSSITYAVKQLESQLDVKAFTIQGRKAVLTPTGELLYRRARYLLDEASALEQSAQRFSAGWEAEIRLAVEVLFPTWLLLDCLERFARESPHTRIDVLESVMGDRADTLAERRAELAIFPRVPGGFAGEALMRVRFMLAAHPEHPLHHLGRKVTLRDLRAHRHLLVRETSPGRGSARSMEIAQRWTFTQLATSIEAARSGYGFALLPEDRIRPELEAGTLKPLPMRDRGDQLADLYLIFVDREHAGPGTRRLAEIIRQVVAEQCKRSAATHVHTRGREASAARA